MKTLQTLIHQVLIPITVPSPPLFYSCDASLLLIVDVKSDFKLIYLGFAELPPYVNYLMIR
jgi:hypothetical protein